MSQMYQNMISCNRFNGPIVSVNKSDIDYLMFKFTHINAMQYHYKGSLVLFHFWRFAASLCTENLLDYETLPSVA